MKFDRKVIEVGEKKTLCISLPSIIVDAYKIQRKDIITLSIYKKQGDNIEFTNKVCRTSNMLRLTIPKNTVIKNSIKPIIYTFEFINNLREGVKR